MVVELWTNSQCSRSETADCLVRGCMDWLVMCESGQEVKTWSLVSAAAQVPRGLTNNVDLDTALGPQSFCEYGELASCCQGGRYCPKDYGQRVYNHIE